MSQTALHSQVVGFVGGTGAQQHLQRFDLACRGHPLPTSSPRVPASPRFENQPPGLAPHRHDVVFRVHWVVNAIDGENDRRDCSMDVT